MSTTESNDRAPAQTTNPAANPIPGDETLWQKYSPNGEPVVSGVASFTIHAIAIGVVLVGLFMLFREPTTPIEISFERFPPGDGQPGGGSGHPDASSIMPGVPSEKKDVTKPVISNAPPAIDSKDSPNDKEVGIGPTKFDDKPVGEFDPVQRAKNTKTTSNLLKELKGALSKRNGPGRNGPGRDGGDGHGKDGGIGDRPGIGIALDPTTLRLQRWELVFNTSDARHYLQQLEALGAIVAIPDDQKRILTIRNLNERPAHPVYEDISELKRIFWIDDRPGSAESVAEELELPYAPSAIIALFPESLEKELLQKELAFRGRAENDILRTRFSISFRAGQHVIRVTEQDAKPSRAGK